MTLELVYHAHFLKSARALPKEQQRKLVVLLERLRENPYDPMLHTKHLSTPLIGLLSFRITRDYRVIFRFTDEQTILLIEAAHRNDIYR